jgi:peptide deformylase
MYAADGVGLAACQIGELQRVAVIDVSRGRDEVIELVNPEIVSRTGKAASEEGCLSIRGVEGEIYRDTINRSTGVALRAQNRSGEFFELDAQELLAICIQHELDHLDGVLFIDHLSRLKRELFKRWFKKQSQAKSGQ